MAKNEARRLEYSVKKEPLAATRPKEQGAQERDFEDPRVESPEAMTAARSLYAEIRKTLLRLPPNQRTALLLCRQHGFSYQEIAGIMRLRLGAVKSLIHRATETLHRDLAPHLEPGEQGPLNH